MFNNHQEIYSILMFKFVKLFVFLFCVLFEGKIFNSDSDRK